MQGGTEERCALQEEGCLIAEIQEASCHVAVPPQMQEQRPHHPLSLQEPLPYSQVQALHRRNLQCTSCTLVLLCLSFAYRLSRGVQCWVHNPFVQGCLACHMSIFVVGA